MSVVIPQPPWHWYMKVGAILAAMYAAAFEMVSIPDFGGNRSLPIDASEAFIH